MISGHENIIHFLIGIVNQWVLWYVKECVGSVTVHFQRFRICTRNGDSSKMVINLRITFLLLLTREDIMKDTLHTSPRVVRGVSRSISDKIWGIKRTLLKIRRSIEIKIICIGKFEIFLYALFYSNILVNDHTFWQLISIILMRIFWLNWNISHNWIEYKSIENE